MKYCHKCKTEKPLEAFSKQARSKDGLQGTCKECMKIYKVKLNPPNNAKRMWINGKYVPKSAPYFKPGRYKTISDAWSNYEIEEKTNNGDVYIVYNPAFEGWFKVGRALVAKDRLRDYQTSSPFRDYTLVFHEYFEDCKEAEKAVHNRLKKHPRLIQYQNEWFMIEPSVIRKVILDVKQEEIDARHRDQHNAQYNLGLCY